MAPWLHGSMARAGPQRPAKPSILSDTEGLAAMASLLPLLCLLKGTTAGPPNILLIVVDNLGWDDVSWHNPAIIMPNIGTLARQGVILEQVGPSPHHPARPTAPPPAAPARRPSSPASTPPGPATSSSPQAPSSLWGYQQTSNCCLR